MADGSMFRGATIVLAGVVTVAAPSWFAGCAHREAGAGIAALRDVARSLPLCPAGRSPMSVTDAMTKLWRADERVVVRGHLSAVSFGPPCDANAPPGAGRHCGVTWTLWSSTPHPTEFADAVPSDVVSLAIDRDAAAGLPALPEGSDAGPIDAATLDLDVTVSGTFPAHLCRHEERLSRPDGEFLIGTKCPRNDYGDCRVDCVDTLAEHPITVSGICRNGPAPAARLPAS